MRKITVRYALSRETAGSGGKKNNKGFTLLETLLVVAILVILLCLAMVGVARWRDYLKITELDNAARAIYMAAENRVVLLRNNGTVASLLGDTSLSDTTVTSSADDGSTTTTNLRVLSSNAVGDAARAVLNDLLPEGVIDPELRDGNFYILYDENTYHVFEVFYVEGKLSETDLTVDALMAKLKDLRDGDRSKRVNDYREKNVASLVGHYAGGLAGGPDPNQLPTPGVEVLITNGEELTLTVKYTMPEGLPNGVAVKREPSVTLKYGDKEVDLLAASLASRLKCDMKIDAPEGPKTAVYTWVLDSLAPGPANVSQRFRHLFTSNAPDTLGGDFTVTASLKLSASGYTESEYSSEGKENSLFGSESTSDTVYIVKLRHLQNLDSDFSGAGVSAAAKQIAEIDAGILKNNAGVELVSNYEFIPIENYALKSYESVEAYPIKNLTVTETSSQNRNGAGLFGSAGSVTLFKNIRLVDSKVNAGYWVTNDGSRYNVPAGGLIGNSWGSNILFENCGVDKLVVSSESSTAGGLVGSSSGQNVVFKNCTVGIIDVKSGTAAGGLAGSTGGTSIAIFENCTVGVKIGEQIALSGKEYAGGLVGNPTGNDKFSNCYVVNAQVDTSGGNGEAGGLAGRARSAYFSQCTASMITVKGIMNAGGLIGGSAGGTRFQSCKAEDVSVTAIFAGGLMGNSIADQVTECYAINAFVEGTPGAWSEVGGLLGRMEQNTVIDGCRVYWEVTDNVTNIKDRLRDGNGKLRYQVSGATAGGLVGAIRKDGTIRNSFAATLVKGSSYAGGLVGNLADPESGESSTVTVGKSYADCYLQAGMTVHSYAGGLIGIVNKVALTMENVYATGFISIINDGEAGGLCGGWRPENLSGLITANKVYAAMHYEGTTTIYPLACNVLPDDSKQRYYLAYNGCWVVPMKTDSDMRNINMGSEFKKLSETETNSYGLDDKASTETSYPFPGLKDLPHYGDWPRP